MLRWIYEQCQSRSRWGVDLFDSGIHISTVFVPGLFGIGSGSLAHCLFPYFSGVRNVDVVNVGPLSNIATRTDRLLAHLRGSYPEWSVTNPINLVGHSAGCNTILSLLMREDVPSGSINGVIFISPPWLGTQASHTFGRNGRFFWYFHWVVRALLVYERLVPEWVRRYVLFNTLLPPTLQWSDSTIGWSVLSDLDEVVATAASTKGLRYLSEQRIQYQTFQSSISVYSQQTNTYTIPREVGPIPLLRLVNYIMGTGQESRTDKKQGYSARTDDVTDYVLESGHHDGVLLVASQTNHGETRQMSVDHLTTVLGLPLQSPSLRSRNEKGVQELLDVLRSWEVSPLRDS